MSLSGRLWHFGELDISQRLSLYVLMSSALVSIVGWVPWSIHTKREPKKWNQNMKLEDVKTVSLFNSSSFWLMILWLLHPYPSLTLTTRITCHCARSASICWRSAISCEWHTCSSAWRYAPLWWFIITPWPYVLSWFVLIFLWIWNDK